MPRDTQEYAIKKYADQIGIDRDKLHRPEPFQMLYTGALHLVATEQLNGKDKGERLLKGEWHWSDVTSSDVNFVYGGDAYVDGARVFGRSRGNSFACLGVCLSRDPS